MSFRPTEIPLGAMRFNSDSQKLEYFNGDVWMQIHTFSPNLGGNGGPAAPTGNSADQAVGARGCVGGGYGGGQVTIIDYFNIASAGDGIDFGDLLYSANRNASCASSTRGYWGGGAPAANNDINTIVFASTGSVTDYGDMNNGFLYGAACGSETRGTWALGDIGSGAVDQISYTVLSSGGAGIDFGNLTDSRNRLGAFSSPTRGVFTGGYSPGNVNTIDFITISTLGNAQDVGDLQAARHGCSGLSNSIRGITVSGGSNYTEVSNIASGGNATKFGDVAPVGEYGGACASSTRGIFAGGNPDSNQIAYVEIATEGNWVDFGDLTDARFGASGCSNAHGGLG